MNKKRESERKTNFFKFGKALFLGLALISCLFLSSCNEERIARIMAKIEAKGYYSALSDTSCGKPYTVYQGKNWEYGLVGSQCIALTAEGKLVLYQVVTVGEGKAKVYFNDCIRELPIETFGPDDAKKQFSDWDVEWRTEAYYPDDANIVFVIVPEGWDGDAVEEDLVGEDNTPTEESTNDSSCGDAYKVDDRNWEYGFLKKGAYIVFKKTGKLVFHETVETDEGEIEVRFLECYRGLPVETFTANDAKGLFPGYEWRDAVYHPEEEDGDIVFVIVPEGWDGDIE